WQWPTTEAFFDAYYYIPATEFTVQQTMAPTAFAWGYLAAVDENLTSLPVIGTNGNDNFVGTNRNDSINGAAGDDVLDGGIGADQLVGGEGDDILIGGYGADVLAGGAGRDRFVFSGTFGSDQITDFQGNGVDQIDLAHFKVTFPQLLGVMTQQGANASIDLTGFGGGTITVHNFSTDDFVEADFMGLS
ncbi:MAG: hypothetical protein HC812_20110, partial [Leptolyngbya sp. RL_3_1]|nr:hypothetical protein [Leptolyngbya sp. RL_3_1]